MLGAQGSELVSFLPKHFGFFSGSYQLLFYVIVTRIDT